MTPELISISIESPRLSSPVSHNDTRLNGFSISSPRLSTPIIFNDGKLTGINISSPELSVKASFNDARLTGIVMATIKDNFALLVQDVNGNVVENATIEIVGTLPTVKGVTDSSGLFQAPLNIGSTYTLIIKKGGFQTYRHVDFLYDDVKSWEKTINRIVPIITLNHGKKAINLKPDEPTNNIYN